MVSQVQNSMKIYVFGNKLVKQDNKPLLLLSELKKKFPRVQFDTQDPNEDFPPVGESHPIILDTVMGIKKPLLLTLKDFEERKKTPVSPHDYDLLFHLLLLRKMKKIEGAMIIGVPEKIDKHSILIILNLIQNLFNRSRLSSG